MLSQEQLRQFEQDGFLVVESVIDQKTLQAVRHEYEDVLGKLCRRWQASGQLGADEALDTFDQQIHASYRAGLDYFQPLDISLPPGDVNESTPFHAGPAIFDMMVHERLLDCVESLLGSEITSNPIQHVRIKPPAVELHDAEHRAHITATDWHQDRAVTLAEADNTRMVTCWIAVTDATVENGCLQAIPGSHRGEMQPHCPLPQLAIPGNFLDKDKAQPIPIKAGSVIMFHPLTVHASLTNQTQGIRWSFDLRYNVTGDPTGRPMFPDFIARSRAEPHTELRDAAHWRHLWEEARARLTTAPPVEIHRWPGDAIYCA